MKRFLPGFSKRSALPMPTLLSSTVSGLFGSGGMNKYLYGSGALLLALQSGMALAQQGPMPADPAAAAPDAKVDAVIVTGTRVGGLKAIDSASPIQVLD
ncbi:MAG TPA: hypothetical protein VGP06_12200, partial [Janthinobacterium sp.]|nr:hypothetical protein [Janthinobacterium sp.]